MNKNEHYTIHNHQSKTESDHTQIRNKDNASHKDTTLYMIIDLAT